MIAPLKRFALGLLCIFCFELNAQTVSIPYEMPDRFVQPAPDSTEQGLWMAMAQREKEVKNSPFRLRGSKLERYVNQMACQLAGDHCKDIRVYLIRTPSFNATMAPNGMMEVWSGLLLRMDNEAQLAAVIGHEIAHYLQRHSLQSIQNIKDKAAISQVVGLLTAVAGVGVIGDLTTFAALGSMASFSRDHESESDLIGIQLMAKAGYDPTEAGKVWSNLIDEHNAINGGEAKSSSTSFFDSHPAPADRFAVLSSQAKALTVHKVDRAPQLFKVLVRENRESFLEDELKKGFHAGTLNLLDRLVGRDPADPVLLYYRAEVKRQLNEPPEAVMADLISATQLPDPPAKVFRTLADIQIERKEHSIAVQNYETYLRLAPSAPDRGLIQRDLENLKKVNQ